MAAGGSVDPVWPSTIILVAKALSTVARSVMISSACLRPSGSISAATAGTTSIAPRYGRADANREIFLERERKAGQTFHHANLRHTVGKGASMFFSMFEETVQKATLDVDEDVVVEEEREKGLFRLDMVKSIAPKPKRQRSLPQHRGTHTLFLNRQLSGVQPPKTLTPRTRSKATSLSLMGVDTSMATDSALLM